MATSRIIGEANRVFAKAFTDMFKDDTYSLILGNKDESNNGIVPAKGSYASSINSFYGDVGAILPEYSQPFPVCKHIKWKRMRFDAWDPTKDQEGQVYYCEYNKKVYLCLDNNDGAISGIAPTGTSATPFKTDDGYYWAYLYSISGLMNQYMRTLNGVEWMPVQPRLTSTERTALASTNPYWLKYEVEKYGSANGGKIVRVVVHDEAKRNIRFDAIADNMFEAISDPPDTAIFRPIFDYIGPAGETDENKRGFQLKRIDVTDGGKGYPTAVSMKLDREPSTLSQNITGFDSNIIVGGDASTLDSELKGPFIYGIASPEGNGFGDAVGLLNAYRSMFLVILDPHAIRQFTDATSWNTAALVRNALYNNKPIKETFPHGQGSSQSTYFSAATVIKTNDVSTSQNFSSGDKLSSVAGSGNNTRVAGTVASNVLRGGERVIRVTGQGSARIENNDNLFEEQTNTSLVSGGISLTPGSSKTPTSANVNSVQKTPLSWGKDNDDRYTEVLHTFEFNSITLDPTADADIGRSLSVAFLIG